MKLEPSHDAGEITQEQLAQLMELQRRLLDLVARPGPLPGRLEAVCRLFEGVTPGALATVMRLDGTGRLCFVGAPSVPEPARRSLDHVTPGPESGSCAHAAWSGAPTFVGDAATDPRWAALRDVATELGIHACWSGPVRLHSHQLAGTFALTSFEVRLPNLFHRQLIELGAAAVGLMLDQDEERVRGETADAELRRMALVAARVPAGAAITDLAGRLQWVNEGMRQLSGAADAELIGRPRSQLLLGERTEQPLLAALHEAIAAGRDFSAVLVNYRHDGQPYTVQLTSTPLADAAGHCEGAVLMETDITATGRLADFNALLAEVTECVATHDEAVPLMQRICELAVQRAGLRLAWIGSPGSDGWFDFLASAGPANGYMDGLRVSTDPALPEGNGSSGRTWREEVSSYNRSFADAPSLAPWHARGAGFGMGASATLPIRRGGAMWAVMTVYHGQEDVFDAALRTVLEAIASSISRGLDRLDLVRRERAIQALNLSMLDSTTVGVVLLRDRVIARANQRAATMLGAASAQQLLGTRVRDLYVDAGQADSVPGQIADAFAGHGRSVLEMEVRRLDGRRIWLLADGAPFRQEGFDQIWSLVDITEQHEVQASHELMARALASVKEGVVITDADQHAVYVNHAFEAITGHRVADPAGSDQNLLYGTLSDSAVREQVRARLARGDSFEGEVLGTRRDGRSFWSLLTISPLRDAAGRLTHFVGVQRNIDDIRAFRDRLEYLAFHDDLTSLPNRRELDRHLPGAIAAAQAGRHALAVGKIDLDDFKTVNDRFGPSRGDQLLQLLSQRIRQHLLPGEFLARVGGDEFVVVLPGRGASFGEDELASCAARLDQAIAGAVALAPGVQVEVSPSMGVAVFPDDGTEGGLLLRHAEEALYQCKQHRHGRSRWWLRHGAPSPAEAQVEQTIAPYGIEASALLHKLAGHLETVLQAFIRDFYLRLGDESQARDILEGLEPKDIEHLRESQLEHMRLLAGEGTGHGTLLQRSRQLGRIHALIGVDSAQLLYWMAVYRDMLSSHFNAQPMNARERYQITQLIGQRIQDDMQAQLQAQTETHEQFVEMVMQALPGAFASWNEAMASELAQLGRMPGIACALVLRQSSEGVFRVEASDGPLAAKVAALFKADGGLSPIRPPEGSLLMRAWQSARVQTSTSFVRRTREDSWGELDDHMARLGIRAGAHVPVLDAQGQPVALLTVLGRFPRQFGSPVMQQFTRNLQQRWSEIWQRGARPPPPVSQELAEAYRRRLFDGGLTMLVQPIVDLHDGRLARVEALARLVLEDGRVIGPNVFIPLLRQAELDRLFVAGLDQALAALVAWEGAGLALDISLNLPPLTLADPACAAWVAEALARYRVAPHRLELELLETQQFDELVSDDSVRSLLDLGVQLAMDDLGSGYSSLRRLASQPFSAIKVDQDLLKRLRSEPAQTISLVSAVIQMGRDFGCDVVVEGLEDPGMIEVARLLGARFGQGYGLGRPMPVDALLQWHREARTSEFPASLSTPIGAVAFQWWSIRHRSLHAGTLDACPMAQLLEQLGEPAHAACELHARSHLAPQDDVLAHQLLDALEAMVRSPASD